MSEAGRPSERAAPVAAARAVDRVLLGGVPLDRVTMSGAIDAIEELVRRGLGGTVFTPNVDHIVECQDSAAFRAAYATVDLSLCDGMPVLWASRLLGRGVPEKVSGSDLIEPLVRRAASRGWRVFLLGGAEGVAAVAAERLAKEHPGLHVVGALGPRIDMAQPRETRRDLLRTVRAAAPDIVLVALGAPKQELWIQGGARSPGSRRCCLPSAHRSTSSPAWCRGLRPGCPAAVWSGSTGSGGSRAVYGAAIWCAIRGSSSCSRPRPGHRLGG